MLKNAGLGLLSTAIVLTSGLGLSSTASADTTKVAFLVESKGEITRSIDLIGYKDKEPNNTLENASIFGLNGVVYGNLNLTDKEGVDIFEFTPNKTNLAYFKLTGFYNDNNFDLYLLDSSGNELARSQTNVTENIYYKVQAGKTYYLKIQASARHNPDGDFDYTLKSFAEGNY
ncbi:hypothetical protein [Bacillus thuringiensis]|uniref:hypothetical protein n=1 Tax=Bacillus thuringiensis TaxID=1428 RepID=UPI000BEC5066|nr:hypothetical protein [Bacillus thuringiensis]PEA57195.1 hypothetical protein CON74_30110 [Bacillus thuringiensis]PER61043.1 hypothetical protein CN486_03275 [Bacillus thuringiensis]PEV62443.1 hypothetical protein CN434_29060 [Bacillus thuringiensis]PFB74600.1 hypothetical protein CN273_31125 [Bacillus thuringiensis]PFF58906.1 hypothetical protein CN334_24435 [Bacillus thuringiensis]